MLEYISNKATNYLNKKEINTELLHSVKNGDVEKVRFLINHKDADVNVTNIFNISSLHLAVANGNIEIAQLLLKAGADIGICDYLGNTALSYAQDGEFKNEAIADLIVKTEADREKAETEIYLRTGDQELNGFWQKATKIFGDLLGNSSDDKDKLENNGLDSIGSHPDNGNGECKAVTTDANSEKADQVNLSEANGNQEHAVDNGTLVAEIGTNNPDANS
ncbi:MAG: hypothetical protein K0R73_896 [Candidatus Midichloriaceae bacterium]|jgi:ankyrin repeat protein|nr:hypothetical protein [Candidatus Midichloriaceae bacterium]